MEERISRSKADKKLKTRFLQALQRDDAEEVENILHTTNIDINTVFEVEDKSFILASYKQGYWLPGYKLESSWAMGLHVCVMYNSLESALVLLENGAAINRKPNGKTPLHVACEVSNSDFVTLLLNHGARVNRALVDKCSDNNDEETPLHTAARFGLPEHIALYICHGAHVDVLNARSETPLIMAAFWSLKIREQEYSPDHHLVCRMLLDYGAAVDLQEEDYKTALHKAAWNCDQVLMQMLLEAGADARIMDINGCSPIQYVLKVASVRSTGDGEVCFQLLLNHGAARIYPPQFHKVLYACHQFPRAVEILINSYEHIKSTKKWRVAIPDFTYQEHREFYDSVFAVCSNTPRTLLHLARCAIRAQMRTRCHSGIKALPIPQSMERYLLLEPEGFIY
ncbi:hypothetical protein JZ751_000292 [Albula glossodonta]|uniref:SOCS box domain-containing protein n=1 Tax=Albula glossodonta TaxID=121402 RepID=A0A8T2PVZ0_9TELE|nr:hypothetical protein JZ751_000292 [Albula glossodonta]